MRPVQEAALLGRIEVAAEDLLARCLESYSSLAEGAPSGIAENGAPASEQPAPALLPAVELCRAPACHFRPLRAFLSDACPLVAWCRPRFHSSKTPVPVPVNLHRDVETPS